MCIYDVYGPCSCPHGRCFTVLAQAFAIGSWVTSMLALTSCFYINVRPIPEEGEPEMPKEGFGWMSRQIEVMEPPAYGKQCAWYTAEERALYFDSMWNAGFAMALISVILGSVVMISVLCTCCVAFQLPTFDGLFWTCSICFVAQALTFLTWGSELCDEMECTWSSGTGMNLTAAMMWVWAANMIKSFPEALPPRTRNKQGQRNGGDDDDDDDDDGAGDVYLSNRNMDNRDNDGIYQGDDQYDNWDNNGSNDQGDGYYDEDGNWVANDGQNYDGYEDNEFENNNSHRSSKSGAYSDYDNDSSGNWAEESDRGGDDDDDDDDDVDNFDENTPMEASDHGKSKKKKKKKRIPGRKKKKEYDPNTIPRSSMSSFDNDDWDDERGSFRYT